MLPTSKSQMRRQAQHRMFDSRPIFEKAQDCWRWAMRVTLMISLVVAFGWAALFVAAEVAGWLFK